MGARNESLGIEVALQNAVDFHEALFVGQVKVDGWQDTQGTSATGWKVTPGECRGTRGSLRRGGMGSVRCCGHRADEGAVADVRRGE